MVLSGLRGVGKTTLLNTQSDHAERQGWLTITLEARPTDAGTAAVRAKLSQELLVALRRYSRTNRMHQIVDPLIDMVRSFSLGLGPATVTLSSAATAGSGDIALDIEELVEAIADALKPRGSAFGLFTD